MKRFLVYLCSILMPTVIVLFTGEYLVRQVPNPYKYKEEWMEKRHKMVETLIFGGSHSFYGIKPNLLSKNAFSLANTSQGLEYDYFLLNKFDCQNLKLVVLSISYPTLFSRDIEEGIEWYRAIFYKIYMDYPKHSDLSRYNFEFTNMNVFKTKLRKYFHPTNNLGFDEYGWGTIYTLSNKDTINWNNGTEAETAARRHRYKNWDVAISNSKKKYKMLDDIASFCENKKIALVLVTTPCWKDYVSLLDKRQLAKMYDLIYEFMSQHQHIVYLDYLCDDRFEPMDFYDSNHLSDIGSIKFTKILKEDIKEAIETQQDSI